MQEGPAAISSMAELLETLAKEVSIAGSGSLNVLKHRGIILSYNPTVPLACNDAIFSVQTRHESRCA